MLVHLNTVSRYFLRPALGLLLIRIATGLIFVHHGWMKLGNIAGTVMFMGKLGIPEPLAYIAMSIEVIGGAMLVLGIMTRAAAVATGIVALVAALVAVAPVKGLFGGEFELLLAAVSFGLALNGAGKYRLINLFEHD